MDQLKKLALLLDELNVACTEEYYGAPLLGSYDIAQRILDAGWTLQVKCKDCRYCLDRKKYLRCVRCGFNNGFEVLPESSCSFGKKAELSSDSRLV